MVLEHQLHDLLLPELELSILVITGSQGIVCNATWSTQLSSACYSVQCLTHLSNYLDLPVTNPPVFNLSCAFLFVAGLMAHLIPAYISLMSPVLAAYWIAELRFSQYSYRHLHAALWMPFLAFCETLKDCEVEHSLCFLSASHFNLMSALIWLG